MLLLMSILGTWIFFAKRNQVIPRRQPAQALPSLSPTPQNPLSIAFMRQQTYPGSKITIEQTLPDGTNYHQYLTSYQSQGLTIYALLTIPTGEKPKNGWPVIVFNHGYIDPQTYQTFPSSGQYASYYPVFATHGYIVFKPDYRGNGASEGQPEGAYYSPAYTIDDLNAIASIKRLQLPADLTPTLSLQEREHIVNPEKIGVWGHSMGGNITLRDLVVNPHDIKAAVIWGGVVGSYTELAHWHDPYFHPSAEQLRLRNKYRSTLQKKYGTPETNPAFWNSIDPTFFVSAITAPVQLDVGGMDEEVPPTMSENLYTKLKTAGKTAQLYIYPGADHNISQSFDLAMQASLEFFDKYLK